MDWNKYNFFVIIIGRSILFLIIAIRFSVNHTHNIISNNNLSIGCLQKGQK